MAPENDVRYVLGCSSICLQSRSLAPENDVMCMEEEVFEQREER